MYLPQAISLPPSLGIERDPFQYSQPVEEVELESTVVTCSVALVRFPAAPLQPRQVRRGTCRGITGPFLRTIARDRRLF